MSAIIVDLQLSFRLGERTVFYMFVSPNWECLMNEQIVENVLFIVEQQRIK